MPDNVTVFNSAAIRDITENSPNYVGLNTEVPTGSNSYYVHPTRAYGWTPDI